MPFLPLLEKPQKSSWQAIASSILSPYIPKNKLLLKEMLKTQEKHEKNETFSLKHLVTSTTTFIKPIQNAHFLSKPPNFAKIIRKKTSKTSNSFQNSSLESLYDLKEFPLQRRRSCHCDLCGKATVFQAKINSVLTSNRIIFHEKQKRIAMKASKDMNISRYKGKTIANKPLNSATLKNNSNGLMSSPMLKSACLKKSLQINGNNTIDLMLNSRRSSIRRDSLSLLLEKVHEDATKKHQSTKKATVENNNLKSSKEQKEKSSFGQSKIKFFTGYKGQIMQPFSSIKKDFDKNEELLFGVKRKSVSLIVKKKSDFIKSAYDSSKQIDYFRKILNFPQNKLKSTQKFSQFLVSDTKNIFKNNIKLRKHSQC